MAVDIDSLQIEIEATSSDAAQKIEQLATALTNLKSAAKGGAGLTTTTKQLQALSNAAKMINGTNLNSGKVKEFASAMNSLSTIQKASGLSSTINALRKLPDISSSLEKADLGKFAQQMNQVASAMRPLATEMQKVANGFSAFPIRIQKIIQSNSALTASNNKTAKSFGVLGTGISSAQAKFGVYLIAFRQIASVMSNWVKESSDYVENVNLFQVAMGDYFDEAFAYAQLVNDKLGIDPSEWMRNQGVFMSMAKGFGVTQEQAYALSEGLTELSYDLSSLYNEDMESSALRLQSALAGEIEPIRRLGISISQATLQEYALSLGIDESVASMTEQEKALLRSMKLMEGAANIGAIGDFARTLESPANALRVLNQQIMQFKRAIGSVMLPVIVQILPYIQAFVELLTEAISALATLVGFTMPEWDASDWGSGITSGAVDATDAVGDTTAAIKELKNATLGIDELNILAPSGGGSGGSGSGGSGTSGWASGLEIPDVWDKAELSAMQRQVDELKEKMKPVLELATLISATILGWRLGSKILSGVKKFNSDLKKSLGLLSVSAGLALGIDNITAVLTGQYKNVSGTSFIKTALSGVLTGLGLVAFGASGWVIPVAVGLSFLITDVVTNWDAIKKQAGLSFDAAGAFFSGDWDTFWSIQDEALKNFMSMDSWVTEIYRKLTDLFFGAGTFDQAFEFLSNGGSITDALKNFDAAIEDWSDGLWESLSGFFSGLGDTISGFFSGLWDDISGFFSGLWDDIVAVWENAATWFDETVISPVSTFFQGAAEQIGGFFSGLWTNIQSVWDSVASWFDEYVVSPVSDFFRSGTQTIGEFFSSLWGGIQNLWSTVSGWFSRTIIDPVVGAFDTAVSKISEFFSGLWTTIKNGVVGAMNKVISALESALNWIIRGINTLLSGFNKIAQWAGNILGKDWSGVGKLNPVSLGRISTYASGGFPESGQLFLAREAGPEMVGQIGRQTAVANNDQIVEGIASANDGVVNAILAGVQQIVRAIEENGGDIYVESDGTATQNRRNRMYGKTLQYI